MSRPPVNPEKSLAGITVDPISLERVIPESRRPDGTVRKQLKVRPGFTPQEDIRRFRGKKQAQMDANVLPKGHIVGWEAPPDASSTSNTTASRVPKAAQKNAKRKEKKKAEKAKEKEQEKEKEEVPENWDDEEQVEEKKTPSNEKEVSVQQSVEDDLANQLEKLDVE